MQRGYYMKKNNHQKETTVQLYCMTILHVGANMLNYIVKET